MIDKHSEITKRKKATGVKKVREEKKKKEWIKKIGKYNKKK